MCEWRNTYTDFTHWGGADFQAGPMKYSSQYVAKVRSRCSKYIKIQRLFIAKMIAQSNIYIFFFFKEA